MSTQSTATYQAERYVRCCPTHGAPVEERGTQLICPKGGGHAVSKFKVIDRKKGTAELVPVDGNQTKGGIEVIDKGTTPGPKPAASPAPSAPAAARPKPAEVLQRAKFTDGRGRVLWVRLIKESRKTGVLYLVRWTLHEGEKATTRPIAADAYQEKARAAYEAKLEQTRDAGWAEAATHRGMAFSPIPAPVPFPARAVPAEPASSSKAKK